MATIQSQVPTFRSEKGILESLTKTIKHRISGPAVFNFLAGTEHRVLDAEDQSSKRFIQNCGVSPVKYAVNTACGSESFHGILAPCTEVDDGFGSQLDFSAVDGYISVWSIEDYRICIFKSYDPQGS